MKTFQTVEDYIEVVGGLRDPVTNQYTSNWFAPTPIINLARYDVAVITSMATQANQGRAFTARQATLITKILLKYQRQLASKLIDVTPLQTPVWRVPLRDMDYTKTLGIREDKIFLTFPYEQKMVEEIKTFSKEAQGHAGWDHEAKRWNIALTEYNLSYLHTWAKFLEFTITPEAQGLMDLITQVETNGYKIELSIMDGVPIISNAPESLTQYINENAGGLSADNILKLVDMSSVLGYTVDPDIASALVTTYGQKFYTLASSKEIKMNPAKIHESDDIECILKYAKIVNRYPIVIYEPNLSNEILGKVLQVLDKTPEWSSARPVIQENRQNKNPIIDPEAKFIHTYTPLRQMEKIPLMISSAGMVFGGDKQIMFNRAEKVVFCSNEVYNKGTNLKVKDINGSESGYTDKG